jgi:hypothetical protein
MTARPQDDLRATIIDALENAYINGALHGLEVKPDEVFGQMADRIMSAAGEIPAQVGKNIANPGQTIADAKNALRTPDDQYANTVFLAYLDQARFPTGVFSTFEAARALGDDYWIDAMELDEPEFDEPSPAPLAETSDQPSYELFPEEPYDWAEEIAARIHADFLSTLSGAKASDSGDGQ